jgi:hypothetical protein
MFHYSLKTRDPAQFLESLLDLLERQHLQLEDFDVDNNPEGEHVVRLSIVTSIEGNRRLLSELPELGSDLKTSTHERGD